MDGMTALARLAGQLLSVGFEGTGAADELRARIAASEVGGVMLFRPNIVKPGQLAALVAELRGAAPPDAPLLVSIDQEGGLVQRLRAPATVWPPMLAVGRGGRRRAHDRPSGAPWARSWRRWGWAGTLRRCSTCTRIPTTR